ncbi:TrkA C-terminal domain-containing protein [Phytohabitans rumicis]|uniref:RCK C-terminal domain-containing protein n=1 Tax=Phytohabitans rumicis TaxID=1076125 RepID=A0A6V8LDY1_9ACTN|nr:hypothetical protein [Phytohabitans rumicis]GFJ93188.1 hypothetical protein Prum_068300 [Phytohabitans rumicis]
MWIDRQDLPGIGTLHAFTTRAGQRVGVIRRRDGRHTLAIYRDDDPQAVHRAATFEPDEAHHIGDLLHATFTVEHIDASADGPCLARLQVPAASPAVGHDPTALKTPGVRVLAVIRDGALTGWPHPGALLSGGDTVVAAGTMDGITTLARLLDATEFGPADAKR